MGTYLLTWNPNKWEWNDLDERVEEVSNSQQLKDTWSTGNTKRIQPGDRLFLIRLGGKAEHKGLMGSGRAISAVYQREHFTIPDRTALYVDLEWDTLRNPDSSGPILPLQELLQPPLDEVNWQSMSSGISLPDNVASYLERRWTEVTGSQRLGSWFKVENRYTRQDIKTILGVPKEHGDWETGYHQHGDDWFIFANVGNPGRTGHDYENHWIGDQLFWYGKTGRRLNQPQTRELLEPKGQVHIFTRQNDRDAFTYEGVGFPDETFDTNPFSVRWRIAVPASLPRTQSSLESTLMEGAPKQALTTIHERNPQARRRCINHYGLKCTACGFDFADAYGAIAEGFIHMHHLQSIATIKVEHAVDPVRDMRPVCPNCHAVIHLREPPLSIEELVEILKAQAEL